jgi:hypothetical protein
VPGAGDRVRQPVREREAVEPGALDAVVGRHRAERDLDHEERGDDPEVLEGGALARRRVEAEQRVALSA